MPPAGTPSDSAPNLTATPFDPYISRTGTRLTTVYATSWTYAPDPPHDDGPPGEDPGGGEERSGGRDEAAARPSTLLNLGRLAAAYDRHADHLPRVLRRERLDPAGFAARRWSATGRGAPTVATLWQFTAPSGQILLALTLDLAVPLLDSIPLLEDLYYADVAFGGSTLEQLATTRVGAAGGSTSSPVLLPERHQLVFQASPTPADVPPPDTAQRIIYRADLPVRPELGSLCTPDELNRRPTTSGALGPYVSLLTGHQDYVENAAFLSAVQAVASAARLREIRVLAETYVRRFRTRPDGDARPHERRTLLERITSAQAHLELELGYSVEIPADLATLIPSLRPTSYHSALYEAMGLTERAAAVSQTLQRLGNATAAELTSVESAEQRAADRRRVRTVVAVTFVTTVTATLGLLFAFFGINAAEVDERRSMFDVAYTPVYGLITTVIVLGFVLYAVLQAVDRVALRRGAAPGPVWHGTHRLLASELGTALLDGPLVPVPQPRTSVVGPAADPAAGPAGSVTPP
ncbi:hypothetical protein [Streptomyces purpureus]|uniref:CorA-like Mg2+ transporter protein n=1 Tax=Streptomyces purpureus TaxID=1951 RepID=A0A918HDM3_9ACTN|nr:hypothetical protein [Streptomyces purpureus]GGT56376.1 hypothetical protein GCM10014713_57590 [Streptomyces purpureus]